MLNLWSKRCCTLLENGFKTILNSCQVATSYPLEGMKHIRYQNNIESNLPSISKLKKKVQSHKPRFQIQVTYLGPQLQPVFVSRAVANCGHHGWNEEEAGGGGPKACGEEDLEVGVLRASDRTDRMYTLVLQRNTLVSLKSWAPYVHIIYHHVGRQHELEVTSTVTKSVK